MDHLPETDVNTQIIGRMRGILEHVALPVKEREKHIRSLIKITKVYDSYRNENVCDIIAGWHRWIS